MFAIPFIPLKMKWVSPELLASRKQKITQRALAESSARTDFRRSLI